MRVLFASTGGIGHFNPLVPFANACLRRGYEVMVAGPPSLAAAVRHAGFPFAPFDAPPDDELAAVWSQLPALTGDEANRVVVAEIFGRLDSTASLPGIRKSCEQWEPDVVVRETAEFGSSLAAELHDVPQARVGVSLARFEHLALSVAPGSLDDLRRSVGLPPDPKADTIRRSPYLTAFPASLEDPAWPTLPGTWRFADPGWRAPGPPLPDWWAGSDAPLVYLTFGSVAGSMDMAVPVYRMAMEAVSGLPVRALLTTGHGVDPAVLGPPPPNMHVERWVWQAQVLAHADAVVCHGGSGSTLGALAAGLPLVVVPLFADQPDNARRVQELGAGVTVTPPDAAAIHSAIRRVLDDASVRAAARGLAEEMGGQLPPDAAVDLFARLR